MIFVFSRKKGLLLMHLGQLIGYVDFYVIMFLFAGLTLFLVKSIKVLRV